MDRDGEPNKGIDQRVMGGCEGGSLGTSFIRSSLQCQTFRIRVRLQISMAFYLSHSLFLPAYTLLLFPRLCVTHPLTLELKFSPPPLLIFSLHYSFITHLGYLCSATMSVSLHPLAWGWHVRYSPCQVASFLTWGGGVKSHKTRDYKVSCLINILQGVTIYLKGPSTVVL